MEIGLAIYFLAMTILDIVLLKVSMMFWRIRGDNADNEVRQGRVILSFCFFIGFVICIIAIADKGYDLSMSDETSIPLWLQEHWS